MHFVSQQNVRFSLVRFEIPILASLPNFLSLTVQETVGDKKLGRSLGTRLASTSQTQVSRTAIKCQSTYFWHTQTLPGMSQAYHGCVVQGPLKSWDVSKTSLDVPSRFTHVCHLSQDILGRPSFPWHIIYGPVPGLRCSICPRTTMAIPVCPWHMDCGHHQSTDGGSRPCQEFLTEEVLSPTLLSIPLHV